MIWGQLTCLCGKWSTSNQLKSVNKEKWESEVEWGKSDERKHKEEETEWVVKCKPKYMKIKFEKVL